jgi:ketosteroid isomerase-like protein
VSSARVTETTPEAVVLRWAQAFNARNLDGVLACVAQDVELRPLRLGGLSGRYRGHDGVRDWFMRLERLRNDHEIVVSRVRVLDDGRVLASGSLSVAGETGVGPSAGCIASRMG